MVSAAIESIIIQGEALGSAGVQIKCWSLIDLIRSQAKIEGLQIHF